MSTTGNDKTFDHASKVRDMTSRSGVYRMLDADGTVLYVGKAKNLKKRVASYFTSKADESPRIRSMVRQIHDIEVTITRNEAEALVLENNLIKELRPRYNVLFRDDKSYPYIQLSEHEYPRLSLYRGSRKQKGRYFGPYPSVGAVRRTLNLMQKLFQIRQCSDSFFSNRSRPCLQYQIKRCTAPCVGYISAEDYARDVKHAVMFLEGRNEEVIEALRQPMQEASDRLDFERAAQYRDQIQNLRQVQEEHHRSDPDADLDVIACAQREGLTCVQVFFVRNGTNIGHRSYFPQHARDASVDDVLAAFIQQYYLASDVEKAIPATFLTSDAPADEAVLEQVLGERAGRKVQIVTRPRGERARWLEMAQENAGLALAQQTAKDQNLQRRLEDLQKALELPEPPERMECFDISHTQGEATVASCVVFGPQGPIKSDYRRFNIKDITPGDDYAAMAQAIQRRYTRVKKEEGRLPDVLLIDGGKGQVQQALNVLEELQVPGMYVLGVAKGPGRRPGLETLILEDGQASKHLSPDSPALHLIQHIRDEAHRFAISGHRAARGKARTVSQLEQIEGVGSRRRQELIRYFGGLQGVARAGVEELAKVPGINKNLARRIYDSLHGSA
ncbi:excinuclease ABC subunit C [Methylohalomonas lacus]|uniref:UvrABC system protein C n=1 Tax=Methylohalomonas lacus TaxID=398773 RepID=A0AAE3L568_9GAMM|nr:excinuclease ABC subunit UvrC [Methylohalomonas lacus]MCS3902787.1 excinuclease ABC subunit C [Methylohalomonas lacus]